MQAITSLHDFTSLVVPERWQSFCFLGDPDGWTVWLEYNWTRHEAALEPLAVDGLMVVGQEQDVLDGGYTKDQSYLGKLTGLTLWSEALTPTQLQGWASCNLPEAKPLITWDDIQWRAYNKTGAVTVHRQGPCNEGGISTRQFLLFISKMSPSDAAYFLDIIGFDIVVPQNEKEIRMTSELVEENERHCPMIVKTGIGAWLGLLYNSQNDTGTDFAGRKLNLDFKKRVRNVSPNKNVVQSSGDNWFLLKGSLPMCFFGTPRGRVVFNLRGFPAELTVDVSPLTFSFVLARHPGHGVYFHGFKRLHIMKQSNSSRWCMSSEAVKLLKGRLCVTLDRLPVGRHEWVMIGQQDPQEDGLKLSLGTCAENQFTCSDATCIDLAKVCDFKFDCLDQSDEVSCTTALLPLSYMDSYPPAAPLPVLANVVVKRIINFDLLSMTFQVNFDLHLSWRDFWITFSNLGEEYKKVTTNKQQQVSVINEH